MPELFSIGLKIQDSVPKVSSVMNPWLYFLGSSTYNSNEFTGWYRVRVTAGTGIPDPTTLERITSLGRSVQARYAFRTLENNIIWMSFFGTPDTIYRLETATGVVTSISANAGFNGFNGGGFIHPVDGRFIYCSDRQIFACNEDLSGDSAFGGSNLSIKNAVYLGDQDPTKWMMYQSSTSSLYKVAPENTSQFTLVTNQLSSVSTAALEIRRNGFPEIGQPSVYVSSTSADNTRLLWRTDGPDGSQDAVFSTPGGEEPTNPEMRNLDVFTSYLYAVSLNGAFFLDTFNKSTGTLLNRMEIDNEFLPGLPLPNKLSFNTPVIIPA
jgi:hypothetical protein